MKTNKYLIISVAGEILLQGGMNGLSIDKLSRKGNIPYSEIYKYVNSDNEIIDLIADQMQIELQQIISSADLKNINPEKAIANLFKKLYELFERKSYYLFIIFITEQHEKSSEPPEVLLKIKTEAEKYLLKVIRIGKEEKIFETEIKNQMLVNKIFLSFRQLLRDKYISLRLIRDFGILKSTNDME
jgi:hypothetical protein